MNRIDSAHIENFKRRKISEWRRDWGKGAFELFGARLDKEQEDILYSIQYNSKTAVASGTARGKDYTTAVGCMCFMYFTPRWDPKTGLMTANTKVALTAPTDRQVKNIMMPEISRLYNKSRQLGFDLPGRLNAYDIRTDFDEWFLTGFKADEYNHEAWSGFHAVNVMFAVTEASGISETVYNAIEGNLQGNSRLLLVFNNNSGTGYAANALHNKSFKSFRLDSLNAPNVLQRKQVIPGQVDWEWVDGRVKDWCTIIYPSDYREEMGDFWWENEDGKICYRPNDLFRVKVRGMAPTVSSDVLVPPEWIEIANRRWKEHNAQGHKVNKPLRLGVDVAGMGRDSSAICKRHGYYVYPFEMIQSGGQANHMEVAGRIKNTLEANTDKSVGIEAQAFIDTIGEGAGVLSRLEEQEVPLVHSVKFSESAEWEDEPLKDVTGQYEFVNMRAYVYWSVRDWLNPVNKTNAMLPPDPEVFQELTQTKWKFRSDGKIQIEKKEEIQKRIKRSPDKADSLANTFYPVPDITKTSKKQTAEDIRGAFF